MKYRLKSETLTQGTVKRAIYAESYPDALELMDEYVDRLDGTWGGVDVDNLPQVATFDELLEGKCGDYHNFSEAPGRWHFILVSGWYYTGETGSETGRLCIAEQRLDPHMF